MPVPHWIFPFEEKLWPSPQVSRASQAIWGMLPSDVQLSPPNTWLFFVPDPGLGPEGTQVNEIWSLPSRKYLKHIINVNTRVNASPERARRGAHREPGASEKACRRKENKRGQGEEMWGGITGEQHDTGQEALSLVSPGKHPWDLSWVCFARAVLWCDRGRNQV